LSLILYDNTSHFPTLRYFTYLSGSDIMTNITIFCK